ncbi:MAG: PASTA domain-containing protein, partial [Nitriliruptoraceae bacterium]
MPASDAAADPASLDPTQVAGTAQPSGPQHLRGVVREPDQDVAIEGATVVVTDQLDQVVGRATSVADGRFTVAALPPGRYRLTVFADGWFRSTVLHEHPGAAVEVVLAPAELTGAVLTEQVREPLLDAKVRLRTPDGHLVGQAETDPQGRFVIPLTGLADPDSPPEVTHRLEVEADGHDPATLDLTLTDRPLDPVTVTLAPTRSSVWRWVVGGVLGLVALVVLASLLVGDGELTVPDLLGSTLEEAADELEAAELELGAVSLTPATGDQEPGTVVATAPEAGTPAEVGDRVDLTLADVAEEASVEVPRVTGRQESDALRLLDALAFDVLVERVASDEDAGIVLTQDPAPRSEVPPGSTIVLEVSRGPEPEP